MIYRRTKHRIVSLQFKAAAVRHKVRPVMAKTLLLHRQQHRKCDPQMKVDRQTLELFAATEVEIHHGLLSLLVSYSLFKTKIIKIVA